MMNPQNPAIYTPRQGYGYGPGMAQAPLPSYPNDPNQYQTNRPPHTPQRPGQYPQQQIPPHVYQQVQQQQGPTQSHGVGNGLTGLHGNNTFGRAAADHSSDQRQSPGNVQTPSQVSRTTPLQGITNPMSNMAMQQPMNRGLAQQAQMQNAVQAKGPIQSANPLSPQSASREKSRVTILLEINAHLLQEVVTLQNQGKAGVSGQSPTSPSSTTDNFNSPIEPNKTSPSKEYQECMRRLQANLSYLAAVADAKKRPDGKIPPYPAIINPPPHLTQVHELYQKLGSLFPEASQSATNKAIAFASAQHSQHQNALGSAGDQQHPINQGHG